MITLLVIGVDSKRVALFVAADSSNETKLSSLADKVNKKARKLGMNTDMRRSIFHIIVDCEVSTNCSVLYFY